MGHAIVDYIPTGGSPVTRRILPAGDLNGSAAALNAAIQALTDAIAAAQSVLATLNSAATDPFISSDGSGDLLAQSLSLDENSVQLNDTAAFAGTGQGSAIFGGGQSVGLAGSNYYYTDSSNTDLPAGNSARTLSFWYKCHSDASLPAVGIVSFGQTIDTQWFTVLRNPPSADYKLLCWGTGYELPLGLPFGDNTLHKVCMTYDGSVFNVWLDGTQVVTSAALPGALDTAASSLFTIGCTNDGEAWYFHGEISHLAIWNTALASSDALSLTDGSHTPDDYTTGLLRYYVLASDLNDSSGNGHNLTNTRANSIVIQPANMTTASGVVYQTDSAWAINGDGSASFANGSLQVDAYGGAKLADYTTIVSPVEGQIAWNYSTHALTTYTGSAWT